MSCAKESIKRFLGVRCPPENRDDPERRLTTLRSSWSLPPLRIPFRRDSPVKKKNLTRKTLDNLNPGLSRVLNFWGRRGDPDFLSLQPLGPSRPLWCPRTLSRISSVPLKEGRLGSLESFNLCVTPIRGSDSSVLPFRQYVVLLRTSFLYFNFGFRRKGFRSPKVSLTVSSVRCVESNLLWNWKWQSNEGLNTTSYIPTFRRPHGSSPDVLSDQKRDGWGRR